jgi:conjugal transfer mating pair stabilization protein TraN
MGACLIVSTALAVTPEQQATNADAQAYGSQMNASALNTATSPNFSDVPSYTASPPQTQYYSNPNAMNPDALTIIPTDSAGSFAQDSFATRPQFIIDKNTDPVLLKSQAIQSDPEAVIGQLSETYTGCETITNTGDCKPTFTNATCDETLNKQDFSCLKDLTITVGDVQSCDTANVYYTSPWSAKQTIGFFYQIRYQVQAYCDAPGIVRLQFHIQYNAACTFLSGCFNEIWTELSTSTMTGMTSCGWVATSFAAGSSFSTTCGYVAGLSSMPVKVEGYSSCSVNGFCSVWTKVQGYSAGACYPACLPFTVHNYMAWDVSLQITDEQWNDSCGAFDLKVTEGICSPPTTVCTIGTETRNISGLDVTRDCWQYENTYNCAAGISNNNCQTLRDQNCEQIDSQCLFNFPDGTCSVFKETLRCPDNNCPTSTNLVCGDQAFCIDGSCVDQTYPPNGDFAKTATEMAILEDMANDFDSTTLEIFKGTDERCTRAILSFNDCCQITGWGQSISIASCSSAEDILAQKRGADLCHYVGTYCSSEICVLTACTCTEDTESHCCFKSKLARIVQEQGRPQLGLNWGTAQAPECQGFTPDQMASLDFSIMNLSEFYADLDTTLPDQAVVNDRIQQRVNDFFINGQ